MNRRKRILFMAEGITMTHFVRPAALAGMLNPDEYEVHFRTPSRYHHLLPQRFENMGDLWTLPPRAFLDALANGSVLYTADVLRRYVKDELCLIDEIQPDLVIGDFRLSLCISARVSGVPFASIFNAHWSPLRRQPAIVPETPITRYVSPRVMNVVFSAIRPAVFALHSRPVNQLRREYGLPHLSNDLGTIYTYGDLTLYPDIPEFVPIESLPRHHHFIGVCPFTVNAPKPEWWGEAITSTEPKVFVSLGSSGPVKVMPAVLQALSRLPVKVLVATSGRDVGTLPPNVYVADLLPYEETARQCTLVISHGGTGGLYPCLAAGVPMLAIPSNIDNHLSADLLERSGAGLSVRVEYASPRNLQGAIERLLDDPAFTINAKRLAGRIAAWDTRVLFPNVLRQWFGTPVLPARVEHSTQPAPHHEEVLAHA